MVALSKASLLSDTVKTQKRMIDQATVTRIAIVIASAPEIVPCDAQADICRMLVKAGASKSAVDKLRSL